MTISYRLTITLIFILSLMANLLPKVASSQESFFQISELHSINNTLVSVTFTSQPLTKNILEQYIYQVTDQFRIDNNGNIWLLRDGQRQGAIVGRDKDKLYHFAENIIDLPPPSLFDDRTSYTVSSAEDQNYSQPIMVERVGRKSTPIDSVWGEPGLYVQMQHTVYLKLPIPLKNDAHYTLSLPPHLDEDSFFFSHQPETQFSNAIHVSHLGFRPLSPSKHGFLSLWAGSLGPLEFTEGTPFHLIDESSGQTAFSSTVEIKKDMNQRDEDAYDRNYTGTHVYSLNFSQVTTPGIYHIFIEGVGRSLSFPINDEVWEPVLSHALKSFYSQRCGVQLGPPHVSTERPRCHHQDDGLQILTSGARLMDTGNGFLEGLDNFSELTEQATDIPLEGGWGGHHDAGDWDRRIQHLQLSRNLFDLHTQFPSYFEQLNLQIPESDNNLADILDEALWSLDFFCRLQEENGAVRGGIESVAHPSFGEPSWIERHQLLAYHPGVWSTYKFAATAAQAARILSQLSPDRADDYRQRALRAMEWAEQFYSQEPNLPFQVRDARNLAAIELYRTTMDPQWHQIFLATTVFHTPGTLLYLYDNHDQAEAAWSYVQAPATIIDEGVRTNCFQAIVSSADYLLSYQRKAGFGWLKYPWRPPFAAAFTVPYARDVIWAWLLTANDIYLGAVEEGMQFVHGANPLNISFTSGVGHAPVRHVTHMDTRFANLSPPSGITVLGPLDLSFPGVDGDSIVQYYAPHCFPDIHTWPPLETFLDVFWLPLMDEFSIETMSTQVYTLGFLASHHTRLPLQ